MKLDMHFHSTESDWKNTPEAMLIGAKDRWLDFIALTDHDVIVSDDFIQMSEEQGIKTTKSVEISAYNKDHDKSLHLTSYARSFSGRIDNLLEDSRAGHSLLITTQVEKLKTLGFDIEEKELLYYFEQAGSNIDNLNKFSIAEYLYKNKENIALIKDINWWDIKLRDFYLAFLKKGGKYFNDFWVVVPNYEIEVETCWEIIKKVDWILSIAHPNFTFKSWIEEFKQVLPDYIDKWVNAIEISTSANLEWVNAILDLKDKYDLHLTFWSDCHKLWLVDDKHCDLWDLNPYIDEKMIVNSFKEYEDRIVV